jgi:hypothetical protein
MSVERKKVERMTTREAEVMYKVAQRFKQIRPMPKPKMVVCDGEIVADADVHVGTTFEPNYASGGEIVMVRRDR